MSLIPFQSLSDPATTVDVEQGFVNGVQPVPPLLLPAGIPAGTRIFIVARGFGNPGTPSYVDVVGTVAATIAALGSAPPPPFGTGFQSTIAGFFQTNSNLLVPVPGTQLTIPVAGTYLVLPAAQLAVDNIAEGLQCQLSKNGGPLNTIQAAPGFFTAAGFGEQALAAHAYDTFAAGDLVEIQLAAIPGGGVNNAIAANARVTLWQVT